MTLTDIHAEDHQPPSGFVAMPNFEKGFIPHNGPVFLRLDDSGPCFGFRILERHCNPLGVSHGGWLATAMDMVLPLSARILDPELNPRFLLTVSMSLDYVGGAPLGAWVEGRGEIVRRTKRMAFVQGMLRVDEAPVVRASGVFRIGPEGPPVLPT